MHARDASRDARRAEARCPHQDCGDQGEFVNYQRRRETGRSESRLLSSGEAYNAKAFERAAEMEKDRQLKLLALKKANELDAFSRIRDEKKRIKSESQNNEKRWAKQHQEYLEQKKIESLKGEHSTAKRPKETRTSRDIRIQDELGKCTFYPKTNLSNNNHNTSNDSKGGMTLFSMADRAMKWYNEKEKKLSTSRSKNYLSPQKSTSTLINERSQRIV